MEIKIECQGVKIGYLFLPPFILKSGDFINLRWPLPKGSPEEEQLENILKGDFFLPNIRIATSVYRAIVFSERKRIGWMRIRNWRVQEYLVQYWKVSRLSAIEILNKLEISENVRIGALNFTQKCLFGIEIAWSFSDTILFDTSGVDPLGIKKIYKLISEHLERKETAIHISYPSVFEFDRSTIQIEMIDKNSTYEILL